MALVLKVITALFLSYLSGLVNCAIIITRRVKGVDIRDIGINNPATSHVVRNDGKAGVFRSVFSVESAICRVFHYSLFP